MTSEDYETDEHGFAKEEEDETMINRRKFMKAAGGVGAAAVGGKVATDGVPKRPAGEGPLGAGIADDVNDLEEQGAPVEDVIEWGIEAGDHPRSQLRPGYLNTTSMFDFDTLDVEVSEGDGTYDVDIDVDLRFTEGTVEDAIQKVHEDSSYDDDVEIRNLDGQKVEDDIFAYHNEFDHEGGNYWTTDRTGITVADNPQNLEGFIGDTPAEFMAAFAHAVVSEGEVGEGHPYGNHGSALIDTIDTDHWAEEYEGLDPGSYEITFNVQPGEEGSVGEGHSLNYDGEIDEVTHQFRSNTHRFKDAVMDKVEQYL
jgi:hypothetical protein